MTETTIVNVTESKSSPRNAMPLPNLHFVVADDWIDKLGEKSFCLYLKLFTMVDRTDENSANHAIKTRTSKLIKRLDLSKSTYLRLIKPLYEYGLVDLNEYEDSKNEGSKPINIVVNRFPQNKPALSYEPLEKYRDWSKRTEESYPFSKQGGRPKKEEIPVIELPEDLEETPTPTPVPALTEKPLPDFQETVNPIVISEFESFKEGMESNGADIGVVVNWVNKNCEFVDYNVMCEVFKRISTYAEPIKKTGAFITRTVDLLTAEPVPVAEITPFETSENESEYTPPKVPFYNWLEEVE